MTKLPEKVQIEITEAYIHYVDCKGEHSHGKLEELTLNRGQRMMAWIDKGRDEEEAAETEYGIMVPKKNYKKV